MELALGEFTSVGALDALCSLLNHPTEEDEELDACRGTAVASVGPGDIGPTRSQEQASEKTTDRKDIWEESEITEGTEYEDTLDLREQPEYEVLFKQRVGTEDMFLGMTRKDPSTACCEQMVIRINLPGIKVSEVSLQVKKKFLDLRTPKHKLALHLLHPVDADNGKAKFVADTESLEVTLNMTRELDFINFL
ncbi:dynein assembly factor 6, axonemal [Xenopus laevis]|uniref:Dynein assembly factor 6, axonemal n=2 Tax=Xenopus laevis TaxID=8355 RepID=A0A1L8F6S4_XENLA|nr:dynein assembly factor 6, axonemal [Xenopus laevis]XP_018085146.1 dynein assembly factor 6, axonemal [Xenopus laevis]XP_018085147.1 dynein assembly factor 6, axonemal [Xenopus laevis]OCT67277.1 hypothetical protein XELAEV_18038561mg [Xenopus laevis]